jgi:hypothetical protein
MCREDLRIQFRAVHYGKTTARVLEYRVDPMQDTSYEKEAKFFFGLVRKNVVKNYSTKWKQPEYFCGTDGTEEKSHFINWRPIWIFSQKELDGYKERYKTIGQFEKYLGELSANGEKVWERNREEYLNKIETLY